MIPLLKKSSPPIELNDKVKPLLKKLLEDADVDVRYYAQNALSIC
jgi:serine/threonine-protein phosphatase 2A regulatory subunit A